MLVSESACEFLPKINKQTNRQTSKYKKKKANWGVNRDCIEPEDQIGEHCHVKNIMSSEHGMYVQTFVFNFF